MSLAVPIGKVPGIPTSFVKRLRRLGLRSSTDLLRADLVKLTRVLGGGARLADVQSWRAAASLLEVEGMTPKWAGALVKRGVKLSSDLALRKLTAVRALFQSAATAGEIAARPDDDQIAALMLDAMRLKCTGVLNVTVLDAHEKPVRGARVVWGRAEDRTDARGRARFVRLPLERSFDLVVHKSGFLENRQKGVRASAPQMLVGERVKLAKHTGAVPRKRRVLSQFRGETIGSVEGRRFHLITSKSRTLRRGDLVRWVDTLVNGEVKLTSRFLDDDGQRLLVRAWRLPRTALPANAALRDDFKVTRSGLVPVKLSARRLARLRILRSLLSAEKPPKNAVQFRSRARALARKLRTKAGFTLGF